jgi:hypothetical protein
MKNKKSIYVLAPAVLLVWALIIYRVSDGLQSGDSYYTALSYSPGEQLPVMADTFAYTLQLNYPDPFLGKARPVLPAPNTAPPQLALLRTEPPAAALQQPVPVNPIDYTRYKYIGLVEHKDKKDQLALVILDGKSLMLRKGETAEGVQLLKLYRDSVELKSGKHRFHIKR